MADGKKTVRDRKKISQSISKQLTLVFLAMLAIIMVAMLLGNTFLLEKFYESRLSNTLATVFEKAEQHMTADGMDTSFFDGNFSVLSEKNNIIGLITDDSYTPLVVSGAGDKGRVIMLGRLNAYILGIDPRVNAVSRGENYTIQKYQDDKMQNVPYLELWGTFPENNYHILLRVSIESIRMSAKISNEFVFYMLVLAAVFSIFMTEFISKKVTKPIIELTELSERMANLDFNVRYTSGGRNEIGRLGEHFNQMSRTLEKTISELKTANNELQANLDAKIKAEDERREFLSNVSHELKTPLALIQGYAEGLQDCVNDDPESRDYYASVIIDEAGKMNLLVRKLMALNQLESGYDKIEMVRFDLAELLHGKAASTKILADQKGASIEIDCPDEVHVWGDEFKVEEVLTNYLSNAINHVEGERKIQVRVEEDKDRHKVRTTVFNTGQPIPEEDLDHVWDKFFKVDKARTRAYGGSGVGLAIVKAIMESFHQKYGDRNVKDGVEFWFELESGDGELVDEEISDEEEYRTRSAENGQQEPSSGAGPAGADKASEAGNETSPVFVRTAGSKENDLAYQEKAEKEKRAAREKEAARKAREEENRAVDADWVPVGKPAGKNSPKEEDER